MLLPQRIPFGARACMAMPAANKKAARRRQGRIAYLALSLARAGVNVFLQGGKVLFLVDAARQGLPHNVAIPVKNVGGGEGHHVQRELTGLAAGSKVDVAVACALCSQQLFGGFKRIKIM